MRRRLALAGLLLVPLLASAARAQSPTPEGTVITNTATASWTDANGNTYTPVSASVSVTVGFIPGPDVTSAASATPASPSTGNTLPFTIANNGNGTDSMTVAVSVGAGLTITGYVLGGTTYPTLAALNVALSQTAIAAGGSIVVTVVYDVAAGLGGQAIVATLTATSRRDPTATAASDNSSTTITPSVSSGVVVTPDGGTSTRLPSNGVQYSETFTVANQGNAQDVFNVVASATPATITIVSVDGVAGGSTSVTIGASSSRMVVVVYTVGNVAAGTTDVLTLTATSTNDGTKTDNGTVTVTVVRPAISMVKAVFLDDQSTPITAADRVKPGDFIQYRITVSNAGGTSATSVQISDPLPPQVTYASATGDAAGWTLAQAGGTVTADLASLAAGQSRYFWIRVQVK